MIFNIHVEPDINVKSVVFSATEIILTKLQGHSYLKCTYPKLYVTHSVHLFKARLFLEQYYQKLQNTAVGENRTWYQRLHCHRRSNCAPRWAAVLPCFHFSD